MKILKELIVIIAICFAGETLSFFLPFPMPGSIIGFFLLYIVLSTGLLGKKPLENSGNFFLDNLQLFLIPPTASLITVLSLLGGAIGTILLICLISTIITFMATAYTVQAVMWLQSRVRKGKI